jgi:hypothetical protein
LISIAHPLSSLEKEEGKGEIPIIFVRQRGNPAAMPPSLPTYNGRDYENKGGGGCDKKGGGGQR